MDRDLQQPLYAANPMPISSGMPMMQQMQPMGGNMQMQGGPTWPYAPQGSVRQVTPQYAQQQMMYAQQQQGQQQQYAVNYPMQQGVTGAMQRSSADAAEQSRGAGQVTLA